VTTTVVAFFVKLRFQNAVPQQSHLLLLRCREKKAMAIAVAFFVELRCSVAPHHAEEGAVTFFVELCCSAAPQQEEEEEGDISVATVAFFFFLFSCNTKKKKKVTAAQRCLLRYAVLQRCVSCATQLHKQTNKINERRKK
jgi:hypothetical protein